MPLFKQRPLATLCTIFLLGLFLTVITDGAATLGVGALSLLLLPLILLLRRLRHPPLGRRRAIFLCACASVLLFSQIFSYFAYLYPRRSLPLAEETVTVVARVEEVTFRETYACSFFASLESVNDEAKAGLISVECDFGAELQPGDRVLFRALLVPLTGEDALYLRADGALASAIHVPELSLISHSPTFSNRIRECLNTWRSALGEHLAEHVPGEGGHLMRAMLLGDRDGLSGETTRSFKRLGLSHVLAISGLHLHILVFLLSALLSRLGMKKKPLLFFLCFVILFYMALTGFCSSVVRAGVMSLLLSLSFLVRERPDSLTSLSLAASLICLFSPSSLFDLGFLLSCFATFGILVMSELRAERARPSGLWRRLLHATLDSLLITLSAMLATLPITALFFGELAWLSPLANLLLTPLFSLYLALAPFALLLAPIPPIGAFLSLLGEWILLPLGALADLPHLLLDIAFVDLIVLLHVGGLLLLLALCLSGRKRTPIVTGACVLLVFSLSLGLHTAALSMRSEVYYTEAKRDEHLLLVDGTGALLYDASNGTSAARVEALTLLDTAHVTELDAYFLSHYHVRHIHTIEKLLAHVSIRALYLPTPTSEAEEEVYHACIAIAEKNGLSIYRYTPYEEISFRSFTLIPHEPGHHPSTEHAAIGLTVKREAYMLTYLGASMAESDRAPTAASAVENSDFLIFGTHGPAEHAYIAYPQYASSLRAVVAPGAQDRLHPTLYALLLERGLLTDAEGATVFSLK